MGNTNLLTSLKVLLADCYALYLKTQNYHWNVEGPNFKVLHLQFEEQYKDLAEAIDTVAEHIRGLGDKAPGTFDAYKNSAIKPGNERYTAVEMLKDLEHDQKVIQVTISEALKVAQFTKDEVVADFMIERLKVHRKVQWMLRSSLL